MLAGSHHPLKVVATDLDGTLLRTDGSISPFTHETMRRVAERGVTVVLVTARPLATAMSVATQLDGLAVICLSGALTYDISGGRVTDSVPLAPSDVRSLQSKIGRLCERVSLGFETISGRYLDTRWNWDRCPLSGEVTRLPLQAEQYPREPVLSVLASCADHAGSCLAGWLAEVRSRWGAAFSPVAGVIEITAQGATKESALARFCGLRGISKESVVAFGDSVNDLPMLRWAGTGVAVGNANIEVLKAVSFTAAPNDEDGVARTLQKLLGKFP